MWPCCSFLASQSCMLYSSYTHKCHQLMVACPLVRQTMVVCLLWSGSVASVDTSGECRKVMTPAQSPNKGKWRGGFGKANQKMIQLLVFIQIEMWTSKYAKSTQVLCWCPLRFESMLRNHQTSASPWLAARSPSSGRRPPRLQQAGGRGTRRDGLKKKSYILAGLDVRKVI